MRTFKLLLPVFINLILAFGFFPIMENELIYKIDKPWMKMGVFYLCLGCCLFLYYYVLFRLTAFWLIRNGKKNLSHSVNIRYLVCGMGLTGIVDLAMIIYSWLCFSNRIEYITYNY